MTTRRGGAVAAFALLFVAAACGGRSVEPPPGADSGYVHFNDSGVGVRGTHPADWDRARAITNFVDPREVLVLATYPLRSGAKAGECAPDHARQDMPAGGAFIWLLEYRPTRGDPWAEIKRDRFPPKPRNFKLVRADLDEGISCFLGRATRPRSRRPTVRSSCSSPSADGRQTSAS